MRAGCRVGAVQAVAPPYGPQRVPSSEGMTILERLIPSIREVRVPLVAGYAWTLLAWLAFGSSLPSASEVRLEPDSIEALFLRAWQEIGAAGQAAALTLTAYLVGTLVDDVLRSVLAPILSRLRRRPLRALRGWVRALLRRNDEDKRKPQRRKRSSPQPSLDVIRLNLNTDVRDYQRSAATFFDALASGNKPSEEKRQRLWELFDVADQHGAEFLLRLHVAAALFGATAVLALRGAPSVIAVVCAGAAILTLWHCVTYGRRLRGTLREIGIELGDDYNDWELHMMELYG